MIRKRGRRGFALVAAIFLLLVLTAAGAMMIRLGGSQGQSANLALLGARSYQAAQSGLEWAAYQAASAPGSCPSGNLSLTEGGLADMQVQVSCQASSHTEEGTTINVLVITSEASWGSFGTRDYVSRRVQATLN